MSFDTYTTGSAETMRTAAQDGGDVTQRGMPPNSREIRNPCRWGSSSSIYTCWKS